MTGCYLVDFRCPCGRTHRVTAGLLITGGPTRPGTVAELYPGTLPAELADLLRDVVWCDTAGAYVQLADRRRLLLTPLG